VTVTMLMSPFAPMQALLLALMIQARHLFYGIAMLDKYKGMGWKKFFLVFGLCDETFSINCTAVVPEGADRSWFMLFVTLFNYLYWVTGAAVGGLVGTLLTFDTKGLGFVMTAMFVVIFMEQLFKERQYYTALIGVAATVACRLAFGADSFLIPTMLCILCALTLFRKPIEKAGGAAQ
jgi:4-azaleucine resistance transporter AzlC